MTLQPIVLDCDPGHDDAIALLYAARHLDVLAITTVFGNASVAQTTRNALRICALGGVDVPVAQGCGGPLLERILGTGFHGETGLDGAASLPEPHRAPLGDHAAQVIIEIARRRPSEVTLVATGPLTNIALALRLEPRLAGWLCGISIMGGSTDIGNETAFAETNVARDPEAADIVFSSTAPVRMAGLNLTRQARIDDRIIRRLRGADAPVPIAVADMLAFYLSRYCERDGSTDLPMHDPTAVLALVRPDLIQYRSLPVCVQLAPNELRGMTAFDLRGFGGTAAGREILVGMSIDGAAAVSHVFDTIEAFRR